MFLVASVTELPIFSALHFKKIRLMPVHEPDTIPFYSRRKQTLFAMPYASQTIFSIWSNSASMPLTSVNWVRARSRF